MQITDVLTAVPLFVAFIAAVRTLAFIRIRGASRTWKGARGLTALALGFALSLSPAMKARAADGTYDREQQAAEDATRAAVAAPHPVPQAQDANARAKQRAADAAKEWQHDWVMLHDGG